MASVNRATLLGNLGADPEIRYTQNGQAVCNFRLATSETWTDKATGKKQERTEWSQIVVFGRMGEAAAEHLRKGSQAYVEGRIQTREWQDKEGQKRWTTEIVASQVVFLGGKQQGQQSQQRQEQQHQQGQGDVYSYGDDGDLPF